MICTLLDDREFCYFYFFLELLDRVLFRLGCAESDDQLETAVNKFLGPVLLKIDSPNENVRKRV